MPAESPAAESPFPDRRRWVADDGGVGGSAGPVDVTCEIMNQRGLHARAAARFVKTVERFNAAVTVFSRGQEVSGHSIMGLMMLAAGLGSRVRIVCEGPEAVAAAEALTALIANRFDEV